MVKKTLKYIQSHLFLRNIILAICFILVFTYFVSLTLNILTRHGQKRNVPNFIGMTLGDANKAAKDVGVTLIVADSLYMPKTKPGTVLDQSPKPETNVKSGRKILLTINSLRPRMEEIPYVTGYPLRQAKNKLQSQGFEIERLVYQSDMATNNVLSQTWEGRKINRDSKIMAELGSGITLYVGRNDRAAMPIVPKVGGLTLREAKSRIWEIGFNIGGIKYDAGISLEDMDKARVYKQTPAAGSRNSYGSKVDIFLTTDRAKIISASNAAEIETVESIDVDSTSEDQMLRELGISN